MGAADAAWEDKVVAGGSGAATTCAKPSVTSSARARGCSPCRSASRAGRISSPTSAGGGCLMIIVAGVQSDVYHRKVKVVSPRMRTPTSWATGRSARRQATAPSARSARPTSRLESCASSCCITGRQCVANSSRPNLRGHLPNAESNRGEGLQQNRKVWRVCRVGIRPERH